MKQKLETTVEKISPEKAKEYLLSNRRTNRNLSEKKIAEYAADMKSGNWKLSHQGICFDRTGELTDGQHRLTATVRAGVAVEMMVTRWITDDNNSFSVIDIGKVRSRADLLVNMGGARKYARDRVAISSALLAGLDGKGVGERDREKIVQYEIEHEDTITKFVTLAKKARGGVYRASWVAAFIKASYYYGEEVVFVILERFIDEKWTSRRDPLRALSDRIMKQANARQALARETEYSLAVSAIRHAVEQTEPEALRTATEDFAEAEIRLPKGFRSTSEFFEERNFVRSMQSIGSNDPKDYPERWLGDPKMCSCGRVRIRFYRADGSLVQSPEGKCAKCYGRGSGAIEKATAVGRGKNPWDNAGFRIEIQGAAREEKRKQIAALISERSNNGSRD